MKSLTEIQENSKGKRLAEGWSDVTPTSIKFVETKKKGNAIIIEMRDEEGREAVDFLYEDTEDKSVYSRISQLAEVAGITKEEWYDGIKGDEVVAMLNERLFRLSVLVAWGNGDGCFVRQYAPASSQPQTQAPTPQPSQAAARPAGRRF